MGCLWRATVIRIILRNAKGHRTSARPNLSSPRRPQRLRSTSSTGRDSGSEHMLWRVIIPAVLFLLTCSFASAQGPAAAAEESTVSTRYALAVIDDATFYSGAPANASRVLNQVLVEPNFGIRYKDRVTLSTSLIGLS